MKRTRDWKNSSEINEFQNLKFIWAMIFAALVSYGSIMSIHNEYTYYELSRPQYYPYSRVFINTIILRIVSRMWWVGSCYHHPYFTFYRIILAITSYICIWPIADQRGKYHGSNQFKILELNNFRLSFSNLSFRTMGMYDHTNLILNIPRKSRGW